MNQYDNPCAHYSLVLRNGRSDRRRPNHADDRGWGSSTYMLRDALRGSIDSIRPAWCRPTTGLKEIWECTRLVVSDRVASARRPGAMPAPGRRGPGRDRRALRRARSSSRSPVRRWCAPSTARLRGQPDRRALSHGRRPGLRRAAHAGDGLVAPNAATSGPGTVTAPSGGRTGSTGVQMESSPQRRSGQEGRQNRRSSDREERRACRRVGGG